MIVEADLWTDDEAFAASAKDARMPGNADLVCVSVHREEESHIAQPAPPPRVNPKNPKGPKIQDPAPEPLPGNVRWRLHYEPAPVPSPTAPPPPNEQGEEPEESEHDDGMERGRPDGTVAA